MARFQSWAGEDTPLSSSMYRFGRALQDMQSCQNLMFMSLETTFSTPLEQFMNREVKPLEDAVKGLHHCLSCTTYIIIINSSNSTVINALAASAVVMPLLIPLSDRRVRRCPVADTLYCIHASDCLSLKASRPQV